MKKVGIILLCFVIIILTGCWDRKEMNEIGIILGTAIDRNYNTGQYICTYQIVLPSNMRKDSGEKKAYNNVIGEGNTILSAFREMLKRFDRKVFLPHNRIIIVHDSVAREGMSKVLDLFSRDHESRSNVMLSISKGIESRKVLEYAVGTEKIPAISLHNLSHNMPSRNPASVSTTVLEFNKKLYAEGINPILGVFETKRPALDGISLQYSGTAVFINDKLAGFLDSKETEGLNFVIGSLKSAIIEIPGIENKNEAIATEVLNSKSSIIPSMENGKISFLIKIKDNANIDEVQISTDVTKLEILGQLEKEHELAVENEARQTIEKVKYALKSDILGFGEALSKKYPKEWEIIKNDWDTVFPNTHYEVVVECKLLKTGLITKRGEIKY